MSRLGCGTALRSGLLDENLAEWLLSELTLSNTNHRNPFSVDWRFTTPNDRKREIRQISAWTTDNI